MTDTTTPDRRQTGRVPICHRGELDGRTGNVTDPADGADHRRLPSPPYELLGIEVTRTLWPQT
ncbi:hypothetical protein ACFWXK_39710 [Streptomyces sp. NPDC059070]|uniref:hypothetical protein n=1 Tax=Streptomyces sp. NPDC059070 TaxID=3346713 RepID=UPI0036821BC7